MEESAAAASCYDRVYASPRPELFFKASPHRVSGHGQPLRIRADSQLERARAGADARALEQAAARRLHDRQRHELPRHRRRQPALSAAGQVLQPVLRPRPVDHAARRHAARGARSAFAWSSAAAARSSTTADQRRSDGPHVREPDRLARPRQLLPHRRLPAHRHRHRPRNALHAATTATSSKSRSTASARCSTRSCRGMNRITSADQHYDPDIRTVPSLDMHCQWPLATRQHPPAPSAPKTPRPREPLRRISRSAPGHDCDEALAAAAEAVRAKLRNADRRQDRRVSRSLRRAHRSPQGRTRRAGQSGNGAARFAAAGRRRTAANDQPTSPGGRRGPRRLVGACRRSTPSKTSARCSAPIGPVVVFGPNNFPFAFNSVPAAILPRPSPPATRSSPRPTRRIPARRSCWPKKRIAAAQATGMPPATVQLIYRTSHDDGERLVSDPRIGATGYTGSRSRGPEAQSRRRRGRQADLPGAVQRQPGRHPARRARRAARRHRRPVRDELPDGHRPVLHESRPGDPAGRRPRPSNSSPRSSRSSKPPRSARCSRPASPNRWQQGVSCSDPRRRAHARRRQSGRRQGLLPRQHAAARQRRSSSSKRPKPCKPKPSATPRWSSSPTTSTKPPRPRAPRRQPHRLHLLAHRRQRRRGLRPARPAACGRKSAACSTTRCPPASPSAPR